MRETNAASRRDAVAWGIRGVVVLEAIIFFLAALLLLGVALPVGFSEPPITDAAIVEGIITLGMVVSAVALFTGARWARGMTIAAHVVTCAGILLGIAALAFGKGPQTDANFIYHRVMLVLAAAILVLILTPLGRAALRRGTGTT